MMVLAYGSMMKSAGKLPHQRERLLADPLACDVTTDEEPVRRCGSAQTPSHGLSAESSARFAVEVPAGAAMGQREDVRSRTQGRQDHVPALSGDRHAHRH
jgi:hypothetical protein